MVNWFKKKETKIEQNNSAVPKVNEQHLNETTNNNSQTPLHIAAAHNDLNGADRITCNNCSKDFIWNESFNSRDDFSLEKIWARVYCPNCGYEIALFHKGKDNWIWYLGNEKRNIGKSLPPNPMSYWGKEIPPNLDVPITKDKIDIDAVKQFYANYKKETQVNKPKIGAKKSNTNKMKQISTKDEHEALTILFEQALGYNTDTNIEDIQEEFKGLARSWRSERIYQGSKYEMKDLIAGNLKRISSVEGFQTFRVENYDTSVGSQITCFFENYFTGIRVYRISDTYYVIGNSAFKPSKLVTNEPTKVDEPAKNEKSDPKHEEYWHNDSIM